MPSKTKMTTAKAKSIMENAFLATNQSNFFNKSSAWLGINLIYSLTNLPLDLGFVWPETQQCTYQMKQGALD